MIWTYVCMDRRKNDCNARQTDGRVGDVIKIDEEVIKAESQWTNFSQHGVRFGCVDLTR